MSANTSPTHYTEDAFVTDANFKVEINQKMKVPDKISFNTDLNGENRMSWAKDTFDMNVPERILVAGQHQHIGTRAPPREIVYDKSILSTEPYPTDLPRVATPPRTLTLDKYPFPGVDEFVDEEPQGDFIPVIKSNVNAHMNDSNYQLSNSLMDSTLAIGGSGERPTPAEEIRHLRRQLANLNKKVVAMEVENLNRLQREKFLLGFGIAYFLLKMMMWMNKN